MITLRGCGAPSAWNPSRLTGLAATLLPALSRSRGLLWQNTAKTTPATADGDPVRVAVCPYTGAEFITATDAARPLLWDDGGGKWSLSFDGVDDTFSTPSVTNNSPAFGWSVVNSSAITSDFRIPVSPNGGLESAYFASGQGYRNSSLIFGGLGASCGFDSAVVVGTVRHSLVASYAGGGVSDPVNYSAWLNGISQTVIGSGGFGGGALGTLGSRGASFYWGGRMSGIVFSSTALNGGDAVSLNNYLAAL